MKEFTWDDVHIVYNGLVVYKDGSLDKITLRNRDWFDKDQKIELLQIQMDLLTNRGVK